jgi:hypothetical protein
VYWESQLLMTPDGTPQPWNPLATVRLPPKTDANRNDVTVPGDWPEEFVVTLWRDPGVRMMYLHERKVPSGEVFQIPMMAKVHWKLTIQARHGGLLAAPWRAQQGDHRDLFPVFDTLSDEGYVPELSWDVDEPTGVTPLIWDKPIALYWRRETNPVRLVQITLTPRCERILRRGGKPLSPDPEVSDFQFSLLATFRLRPDGERQIVLPTAAIPNVGGKRDDSDRPQPTWYRWATRDQLAGWLAEPVPDPAKP